MPANAFTDALRDLWGPGLVFLALCGWLVRRAVRAARNESILEEQRLREALGPPTSTAPSPSSSPLPSTLPSTSTLASTSPLPLRVPPQLFRADVRGASQAHLEIVARLQEERQAPPGNRIEILWVRSNATHVAWAESRPGNREVICIAQIDGGSVVARWQFG
ncbi:MAG: hypothetical protein ACJ79H_02400 [Myxococcales bacterium]